MLFVLIVTSSFSHAVPPCAPHESLTGSSKAVIEGLTKINVVDGPDRRTAADYAKEHPGETEESIQRRYAATGDLNCPGGFSQANVTIQGNVITTAAHSIFPGKKDCGKKNEASKCKFVTELDGKKETYEVESMMFTGWDCGRYDRQTGSDWAILKLKKSVDPRIKPYRISKKLSEELFGGDPVTAIGKSIDFPTVNSAMDKQPRHYGDCEAKMRYNFDQNNTMNTNCDLDHRSSGGALVTQGPDPILLGVHEALSVGGKKCPKVAASKRSGPWTECWGTETTLITGDFYDSLEAIEGSAPASNSTSKSP